MEDSRLLLREIYMRTRLQIDVDDSKAVVQDLLRRLNVSLKETFDIDRTWTSTDDLIVDLDVVSRSGIDRATTNFADD